MWIVLMKNNTLIPLLDKKSRLDGFTIRIEFECFGPSDGMDFATFNELLGILDAVCLEPLGNIGFVGRVFLILVDLAVGSLTDAASRRAMDKEGDWMRHCCKRRKIGK